jgi:hypothetical protein
MGSIASPPDRSIFRGIGDQERILDNEYKPGTGAGTDVDYGSKAG